MLEEIEGTFRLNATVENYLARKNENVVDENEDEDDFEDLPFDQDHNSLLDN